MFSFGKSFLTILIMTTVVAISISSCSISIPGGERNTTLETDDNTNVDNTSNDVEDPTTFTPTLEMPLDLNFNYNEGPLVTILLPPGSPAETEIYYTVDGTDPKTSISSIEYTAPFTIDSSMGTTVYVRIVAEYEGVFSEEVTGSYWFGDWEMVGTTSYPIATALAIDNNIPYIARQGSVPGTYEVEKLVNGIWTLYPAVPNCYGFFGGNHSSYFFVEDATPYISCFDGVDLHTKKYVSGSWTDIGSALPFDPVDVFLIVENETPYIAFIDHNDGWQVYVYYFDGLTWQQMGSSVGVTNRITFKMHNGTAYVGVGGTMKKFDGSSWNTLWTLVGNEQEIAIYDDGSTDGKLYNIYSSGGNLVIRVYENGSLSTLPGITGFTGGHTTLNVHDDIPYISYSDSITSHIVVKRLYNETWQDVGTESYYTTGEAPFSLIAENGNVYLSYFAVGIGLVESFGPGGSGITAHVDDPLLLN